MSDMKDWPLSLRVNAASCELARVIYQKSRDAYGGLDIHFEDLPASMRQRFVELAVSVLKQLQPKTPTLHIVKAHLPLVHWQTPCTPEEHAGDHYTANPHDITCDACKVMIARWLKEAEAR